MHSSKTINTQRNGTKHERLNTREEFIQSLTDDSVIDDPEGQVWGVPQYSTGTENAPKPVRNEQIFPEQLVQQGMDEAEREQRLAAAEEKTASDT